MRNSNKFHIESPYEHRAPFVVSVEEESKYIILYHLRHLLEVFAQSEETEITSLLKALYSQLLRETNL